MRGLPMVVSRSCVVLAFLFSVQCVPFAGIMYLTEPMIDNAITHDRIKEIKTWLPNSELAGLYKITSEDTLRKTINFVENPGDYFYQIRTLDMTQFWDSIRIYDAFMYDNKKATIFYFHKRLSDFYGVGHWHGVNASVDISIITFLLLNCPSGDYGGLIKDLYLYTFASYWHSFIPQLKKRRDWKLIVDEFGAERTEQIEMVMIRLGKSEFEKELREYLLTRYPTLRESVEKKKLRPMELGLLSSLDVEKTKL